MPDISDAMKRLDAIAASAGIEPDQPRITLADIDIGLAELKALADKNIAATLKRDAEEAEAEQADDAPLQETE